MELKPKGAPVYEDGMPVYQEVEAYDCSVCGYCPTPEHCVWSVVCPECGAGVGMQCTRPGGLVPLHKERYDELDRRAD